MWWTDGPVAALLEDWNVSSLSPGQGNLENYVVITITNLVKTLLKYFLTVWSTENKTN